MSRDMTRSPDYELAGLLLSEDDFMSRIIDRLDMIGSRAENNEWLPGVRRAPASRAVGKTAVRVKQTPSDQPTWRDQALCLRVDGDWFDIPRGARRRRRAAKELELSTCDACDVTEECLEYGMSQPEGIWGGLLPEERRERRRRDRDS